MKDFMKEIEKRILIHDGSKGYMLQKLGLKGGECGELWNLTNKQAVREVYHSYLEAGSDVIQTNTFPGNRIHLEKYYLGDKTYDINYWGAKLAKEVAGESAFVCASIGPTGLLFEPSGELTFERAFDIFCEQVKAVVDGGADIINFETFTDLAELRAAFFAAKKLTDKPVICSLAFENNSRTLMGTDPVVAVAVLRSIGADMAGTNCSFGPEHMTGIIQELYQAGGGYLSVKPNAGLPQVINDQVIYDETPEHFAEMALQFIQYGARLIGGCCGTTPDYIKALKEKVSGLEPVAVKERSKGMITSNVRYLDTSKLNRNNIGFFDTANDPKLRNALKENNLSSVEDAALDFAAEGFDAVYVNIDDLNGDKMLLSKVIDKLQWYIREPLILETADAEALNNALLIYRGVAGVVLGKECENQEAIKKTVEKFGSVILEI